MGFSRMLVGVAVGLLAVLAGALTLSPVAAAHSTPPQTLHFRVPIPAANDVSVMSFELSIGGLGKHHHKQTVVSELFARGGKGVFALARLRAERGHPGLAVGVVEVFHRAGAAAAALPSGLAAFSQSSPLVRAHTASPSAEFVVRAHNEHVIKETLKDNIVALATAHDLGADDFCDPRDKSTYLLGNDIIFGAYILAGVVTGLPTNTSIPDLVDDAVYELCEEIEEEDDDTPYISLEHVGIAQLYSFLGVKQPTTPTPPPSTPYYLAFNGGWAFANEPNEPSPPIEIKLNGTLSWAGGSSLLAPTAPAPVTAIEVVLPSRAVTNDICPGALPMAAITTTTMPNDTLMCSGGTLALDTPFSLNVQTSPPPLAGMGGQLLVQQNGTFSSKFTFGGP
jgi:hypothetical protein